MPILTINKTYVEGQVADVSQMDAALDSISTFLNTTKLDSANIQSAGVIASNLAANSVTSSALAAAVVSLAKLAADVTATLVPTGAVSGYAGTAAPTGWLICDGSAVARTGSTAALFGVIGTAHGSGDGTTTFNVPDYRGRFLRGVNSATGRDPDAGSRSAMATGGNTGDAIGSLQGQATAKNGLALSDPTHNHTGIFDGSNQPYNAQIPVSGSTSTYEGVAAFGTSGTLHTGSSSTGVTLGAGDNETRPVNASVNFIIKL